MASTQPLIDRIKIAVPQGETRLLSSVAKTLRVSRKAIKEEVDGTYEGVCVNIGFASGNGHADLPREAWEVEHYGV